VSERGNEGANGGGGEEGRGGRRERAGEWVGGSEGGEGERECACVLCGAGTWGLRWPCVFVCGGGVRHLVTTSHNSRAEQYPIMTFIQRGRERACV
jgi:hypothetical protein